MSTEASYQFEYFEGCYFFHNEQLEVVMDEATFEKYFRAYLISHGLDTRTEEELMAAVSKIQQQQKEVEKILMNPEYWKEISDPDVRVIRLDITDQQR